VAYLAGMQMSMSGEGEAAAMLSQMGSMKAPTTVTSLSTDTIADEKFAAPAGYAAK
jgi:hypothetical protein